MNAEANIPENILSKIQKLYAKSISSKSIGSLAEAEAFMLKVQQLLSEYNLEMSMIKDTSVKSEIGEDTLKYEGLVSYGKWETDLMTSICRHNWCECLYNTYTTTMTIIGRGDNIAVCKYMYNFITINFITLSKKSYYEKLEEFNNKLTARLGYDVRERAGSNTEFEKLIHKNKLLPYRRYYIRDYLAGAVAGIDAKFDAQQRQQRRQAGVTGLVLFNDAKIKEYLSMFHANVTEAEEKKTKRGKGYTEGYNDGYNLKIGEQLDGKEHQKLQMDDFAIARQKTSDAHIKEAERLGKTKEAELHRQAAEYAKNGDRKSYLELVEASGIAAHDMPWVTVLLT